MTKCEWCGSNYPPTGMIFRHVVVFGKDHVICDDCFNNLKVVHPLACNPCQPTSPECDGCTRGNNLEKPDSSSCGTDLVYLHSEIKHTFIVNETGTTRDVVDFSGFSWGSFLINIRTAPHSKLLYSKSFKTLAEFIEDPTGKYNKQIVEILKNKIILGSSQGHGIPTIKVVTTEDGIIQC